MLIATKKNDEAQADREWYASLMLNRLMFTYWKENQKITPPL